MTTKNNQRGYYNIGPSGGEMAGCLGIAAGIFIGVGIFLGWFAPVVWGWVKPWIHAVTG